MNNILQLILIIFTLIFGIFIIIVTHKKKLSFKYTLMWLFLDFITLLCAIFPQMIIVITKLLHIETPVNAIFLMYIFIIIVTIFYISIGFSKCMEKTIALVQENALLEKRVRDLEKKLNNKENC